MSCKNLCQKHKVNRPSAGSRYADGQKRCQICDIFLKWDGLFCPCCGYRLRTKPRAAVWKNKLTKQYKRI